MRRIVLAFAAFALAQFASGPVAAQTYPSKPVRLIVPWAAGGTTDILGRILGQKMAEKWGQPVLVENRGGAAGNIGTEAVVRAPADGYTLLLGTMSTHAMNQFLYTGMSFDPVKDIAPISLVANVATVLVVHPSLPVKTVAELVKLTRARPGEMNYASTGAGSATFLAAELFKGMAGVNIVHVPYLGGGEAVTAIIAGEVSVYFAPMASILPYVRQGRVRAVAATTLKRLAQFPQLPTIAESGYDGYQAGNWYGIFVPVKTPRDIVMAIRAGAVAAMSEPATQKRLIDLGYLIVGDQPEEFAAFLKSEIASFEKIIRQTGLKVE